MLVDGQKMQFKMLADLLQSAGKDTATALGTLGNVLTRGESPGAAYQRAERASEVFGDYDPGPEVNAMKSAIGDKVMGNKLIADALGWVGDKARENPEAALQVAGTLAITDIMPGFRHLSAPIKKQIGKAIKENLSSPSEALSAPNNAVAVAISETLQKNMVGENAISNADAKILMQGEYKLGTGDLDEKWGESGKHVIDTNTPNPDGEDVVADVDKILAETTGGASEKLEIPENIFDPDGDLDGYIETKRGVLVEPQAASRISEAAPANLQMLADVMDRGDGRLNINKQEFMDIEKAREQSGFTVPYSHLSEQYDRLDLSLGLHGGDRGIIYGYDPRDMQGLTDQEWGRRQNLLGDAAVGARGFHSPMRRFADVLSARNELETFKKDAAGGGFSPEIVEQGMWQHENELANALKRFSTYESDLKSGPYNLPLVAREGVIGNPTTARDVADQNNKLSGLLGIPPEMTQELAGAIMGNKKAGRGSVTNQMMDGRLERFGIGRELPRHEGIEGLSYEAERNLNNARKMGVERMLNDYMIGQGQHHKLPNGDNKLFDGWGVFNPDRRPDADYRGQQDLALVSNLAEAMRSKEIWKPDWETLEKGSLPDLRGPFAQYLKDAGFTGTMAGDEMQGLAMAILDPDNIRHRNYDFRRELK